ncbi:diguanylate cyclase [Aquifex pyrophilus]
MSLYRFILFIALGTSLIIAIITSFLFLYFGNKLIDHYSMSLSRSIARQTFRDMFNLMSRGWTREDLINFLKGLEETHKDAPTKVFIFRGEKVKALFGTVKEPPPSPQVIKAFLTKEEVYKKQGNYFVYTYPVLAKKLCLRCHVNAKERDVLGVVEVRIDTNKLMAEAKRNILLYGGLASVFPLIGALFFAHVMKKRLSKGIKALESSIKSVNTLDDLSLIEYKAIDFGFKELNEIRDDYRKLIEKVRETAIDKKVLEFEVKLLEKFLITSEAVVDWKGFLSSILKDISKILDFIFFFVVFRESANVFSAVVFWNRVPSTKLREKVVEEIKSELKRRDMVNNSPNVNVENIILWRNGKVKEISDFRTITKKLFLRKPLIGGIVGIGVDLLETEKETKIIAIEGLLSTLLNFVGSIKAINIYTQELEYYATRDPLTGLYNQRVFWELLTYEIERAKRHNYKFTLLVLDIDNFKMLNDRYGHEFGDNVILKFAEILRKTFRREDLLARYGGDEFVVIMPYTDAESARSAVQRLLTNLNELKILAPDGNVITLSVSVGGAVYPEHGSSPKELFVVADNMMYKVKTLGKGGYRFPEEEDIREYAQITTQKGFVILNAIESDKVIPYFQPILDLKTNDIFAFEVLMRIKDKDKVFSAGEFIEVAESLGIIHKLDYKVIKKALKQCKASGKEPILFFNISPKELLIRDFFKEIKRIVDEAGYKREKIVFEITERETVRNLKRIEEFIKELKKEGFRFALDDFGSGFASFTYVKLFPIDFIKIEGEFIRSMVKSKLDRAFVIGAVTLAKTAGIKTIAEFVENEEIYKLLKEIGVDYAQGYFIGEPRDTCS